MTRRDLLRACRVPVALAALAAGATVLRADQGLPPGGNPIDCWARTTAGSVRVGESFGLTLTCAALETDALKVIIDQASLDPSALRVAPFEVLSGTSTVDQQSGDRRFFQFSYTLRLIASDAFGKDVKIPEIVIPFRLQTRVGTDTSIEGRDHQYILPVQAIRILSLVPADAPDIRDGASAMFADVERRSFRARALMVAAGVLFALAGLAALVGVVRLVRRDRPKTSDASRLPADSYVLRSVGRELSDVWQQRQQAGWTPGLIARALAGLRIVGAFALGRPVSLREEAPGANGSSEDGVLRVPAKWFERRQLAVSSALTRQMVRQALADSRWRNGGPVGADELEQLERALAGFTEAKYGSTGAVDEARLDASLQFGVGLERRLRVHQSTPMKQYRAVADGLRAAGARVWWR